MSADRQCPMFESKRRPLVGSVLLGGEVVSGPDIRGRTWKSGIRRIKLTGAS